MRRVTIAALLLMPALPAVAQTGPAKPTGWSSTPRKPCAGPQARQVTTPGTARPRPLNQMPDAHAMYTVVRQIDGCPQNVSVARQQRR